MYDRLSEHVLDSVLTDIKPGKGFSLFVAIAQLCHEHDRVHTGVLSQSVGNEFQSFSIGSCDVGVSSKDLSCIFLQLVRDLHFDASSTGNESLLLDKSSDDAKSIMERTISFVENELVRASQ